MIPHTCMFSRYMQQASTTLAYSLINCVAKTRHVVLMQYVFVLVSWLVYE